jgi:hypothetical protein
MEPMMMKIENQVTGEVVKTGATTTELKNWAIRTGLFKVERTRGFRHILQGDWAITREAK